MGWWEEDLKKLRKKQEKKRIKINGNPIKSIFDIPDEYDDVSILPTDAKLIQKLRDSGISTISKLIAAYSSFTNCRYLVLNILTEEEAKELFYILGVNHLISKDMARSFDIENNYKSLFGFIDPDEMYNEDSKIQAIKDVLFNILSKTTLVAFIWSDVRFPRTGEKLKDLIDYRDIHKSIMADITKLFYIIDPYVDPEIYIVTDKYVLNDTKKSTLYNNEHGFTYSFLSCKHRMTDEDYDKHLTESFFNNLNIIDETRGEVLNFKDDTEKELYWIQRNKAIVSYYSMSKILGTLNRICKRYDLSDKYYEMRDMMLQNESLNLIMVDDYYFKRVSKQEELKET